MRCAERKGAVWALAALGLGVGLAWAPPDAAANGIHCPSGATCFSFSVELGPQRTGDFATLALKDVDEGVKFTITLNEDVLGSHANLNQFYFSLPKSFDDDDVDVFLVSRDDDDDDDDLDLDEDRPVRGGAGANFEFSLDFDGNGHDRVQSVSFVIEDLTTAEVLEAAFANPGVTGRGLEVLFAAHIQGSGNGKGSASATVGVPVPEPGTAALFGLGLTGIAFLGRRRS